MAAAKTRRVDGIRATSALTRSLFAALLGVLLALRLLTPAGFMPAFEHGSLTIVACPDYDPAPAPMARHHHDHGSKKFQQHCPYAAGNAAATPPELTIFAAVLLAGTALLLGRTFRFLERHRAFERPPLRGPPLPA